MLNITRPALKSPLAPNPRPDAAGPGDPTATPAVVSAPASPSPGSAVAVVQPTDGPGAETMLKPVAEAIVDATGITEYYADGWLLTVTATEITAKREASRPPNAQTAWPGIAIRVPGIRAPLLLTLVSIAEPEVPADKLSEHETPAELAEAAGGDLESTELVDENAANEP